MFERKSALSRILQEPIARLSAIAERYAHSTPPPTILVDGSALLHENERQNPFPFRFITTCGVHDTRRLCLQLLLARFALVARVGSRQVRTTRPHDHSRPLSCNSNAAVRFFNVTLSTCVLGRSTVFEFYFILFCIQVPPSPAAGHSCAGNCKCSGATTAGRCRLLLFCRHVSSRVCRLRCIV